MRWKKIDTTEWHKVFAWWPVTTVCNNVVWLEYVEYRDGDTGPDADGFGLVRIRPSEYRLLSTSGGEVMSDYHEGLEEGIKIGKAEAAARIAELEAALRLFAGMADYCETDRDSESACVFVGDLRAARAVLEGKKDE